jgi:hypothetical protein
MCDKWKKYSTEKGIRQIEKNLLQEEYFPEFEFRINQENPIYFQVFIYSSINRKKVQVSFIRDSGSDLLVL